ncbi:hypothetical protein AB3N59_04730 [Leptospira sp. WS92.C1]
MKNNQKQNLLRLFSKNIDTKDLETLLQEDPDLQREYFELIRIKTLLGSLDALEFPIAENKKTNYWKTTGTFFLAAACLILVFGSFLFYQKRSQPEDIIAQPKATSGNCEQNAVSFYFIEIKTQENSYCDFLLKGSGEFKMRIFPNTNLQIVSSQNLIELKIQAGSFLFSSITKKEGVGVQVNGPHIRSQLLGTSLFIAVSPENEKVVLIEGEIQVITDAEKDPKGSILKSGYVAEIKNPDLNEEEKIQINKISPLEDSILQSQFDSMEKIHKNDQTSVYSKSDIGRIQNFQKFEQWSSQPYVKIKSNNGNTEEGYLIEIGEFYSVYSVQSGLIRFHKDSIREITTLRK